MSLSPQPELKGQWARDISQAHMAQGCPGSGLKSDFWGDDEPPTLAHSHAQHPTVMNSYRPEFCLTSPQQAERQEGGNENPTRGQPGEPWSPGIICLQEALGESAQAQGCVLTRVTPRLAAVPRGSCAHLPQRNTQALHGPGSGSASTVLPNLPQGARVPQGQTDCPEPPHRDPGHRAY